MCLKYLNPDSELQNYALQVMGMLRTDTSVDAQALACVLYIMRVGITDQMSEPTQRGFSVFLAKQLVSSGSTPSMRVAALRTLAYVLKTLGEVPLEFKEVLDDTVVAALSHDSPLVRVEAALTLRAMAEVDPSCVGGLISYAVTMLTAARDTISSEKGSNFKRELESLHGQAAVLAALVSISRKLPLGYPTKLPKSVLEVCKNLLMQSNRNPVAAAVEKEAGWNLLSSLLTSVSREELHDQVFDILALWASTFSGNVKQHINQTQDLTSDICVWSAAIDALTSYVKCFVSPDPVNRGILLQPVLFYLNRALSYVPHPAGKEQGGIKSSMDLFITRVLLAYEALSDPALYKSDHGRIIQICTTPFRDLFEDELRSFQGGYDGVLTCVWENEPPSFPQSILAEGDICPSQRRASSEGLGLLARLGNDIFTARLTKQFLGDVASSMDSNYAGSIAFALGCIHRSAGGMALSSLVPITVNVVSSLAKSSISSLQIWSLHGLLLTIEAAGLSYVSQVQIKVRLLTVHASLKCYVFESLRRQGDEISDEYLALLPLFAKSSSILGAYWLSFLKDYIYIRFHLRLENWKPFLDGIQSSVVSVELQPCLEEAWLVILQALVLDAVPAGSCVNESSPTDSSRNIPTSGYSMVELQLDDFQFLWGFLLMLLFQEQDVTLGEHIIPMCCIKSKFSSDISVDDSNSVSSNILFPVFQFMSTERFFSSEFLTVDACSELLQVFSYLIFREATWDCLAVFFLSQVVQNCPKDFLNVENFAYVAAELCVTYLFKLLLSDNVNSQHHSGWENSISAALTAASTLLERSEAQMQLKLLLPFLLVGYKCIGEASTEISLSRIYDFVQSIASLLKRLSKSELGADGITHLLSITRACLNATVSLTNDCVQAIHQLENKRSRLHKMLLLKLAYSVEQFFSYATLAFVFEGPGENQESNPLLSRGLHLSIQCIESVLTDSDIQVVKVMLQKGLGAEFNAFLIFFVVELLEGLFSIVRNILEKPINREAVAIAGEGLKILMLLQTLSKGSDYQKGLIHLLLEAILMIFSASNDSLSQEANDLRNVAVILVSQLAQIPSSAASIKDILLAMPVGQRQQLQDIIRASVNQDKDPKPLSSPGPPLVIKLPSQTEQSGEKNSLPLDPPEESNNSNSEEEDDWDTFQSFPASGSETIPAPESRDSDYEESSASLSLSNKESLNVEDHELGEAASAFHEADSGNQMEESDNPEDGSNIGKQSDEIVPDLAAEELPNIQSDEVAEEHTEPFANYFEKSEMVPSHENDQPLPDVQHISSTAEHQTETSHDYEQGLPDLQPMEFSQEHAQPSTEPYDEGTDIPDDGNIVEKSEQETPVVSTNDSEGNSIQDANLGLHERTSETPILSNIDDQEDDDKKLPGN
ncbi:UNVERIFIED_CONTAM: protein SWEETIE [Sesamum calycinum]|uniref:Protein SWEETIE n=1 Tax=Sesamum calycinum TaxID=2727403 RepID=A0AAW2MPT6_9LAMI